MKIANRYEIIKQIGKGGMANVYLAYDTILNREVAIKILKGDMSDDPVALERFAREANTYTKLSHPNAVDVYDVGSDNGYHYIVMEYVKGYTLKQLISRQGALSPKEAVWLMKQLSSALLEAHKNGIIHRDIKSQNVLIKADGTVKLADFGIAIINNAIQLTSRGSVLGSVHYLAPELAKGGNATMQSDIYSLGIVFYELLTGDVPYKADTPIQVALKHVRNDVPSVRGFNPAIPQSIENIIIKATARSLQDRYANIALFIKDLNRCLTSEAKNDKKIILKDSKNTTYESVKTNNSAPKVKKAKETKTENIFNVFFICLLSVISIVAIVFILYISGIFTPKEDIRTIVPDIKGLSITEAKDTLATYGLNIDDSNITWQMTDNIPVNQIISFDPDKDTEIEKGSKVKITVSEGIYSIMGNYEGYDINEAKQILADLNISVKTIPVESDLKAGTIITQEGLLPNDKYNPNYNNTVTFTYSIEKSISIPFDIIGKNVDEICAFFTSQGFTCEKQAVIKEGLSEVEQAYGPYTVVGVSPELGTYYIQEDDSKIILYYFEEVSI